MTWTQFITTDVKVLGWTLLHTVWQAGALIALLWIALKLIGKNNSEGRYLAGVATLLLILASSIATFLYLSTSHSGQQALNTSGQVARQFVGLTAAEAQRSLINITLTWINQHIDAIVLLWAIGVFLFSLRFVGGLLFIYRLKQAAIPVANEWHLQLKRLSAKLGVTKVVALAESVQLSKPVVIGHLKPIILLPVGLLTGMPTIQIEAIILHELSHIKRNDYLINIIQTLLEIALFFNPFVWIISNTVRKERENCCDDQVTQILNPISYVQALAQLEELHIGSSTSLALAFNGNKFQVINRIKRIMEKSVKPHDSKVRPLALVLLVTTGLMCASWLTFKPENKNVSDTKPANELSSVAAIPSDTSKKEEKSATYSKRVITTYDKDGKPHQDVVEEYEGDEDLRPMLDVPDEPDAPFPPMPDLSMLHDPFFMNMMMPPGFESDSLPGMHFYYDDDGRWEEFGEKMRERFENNEEFTRMMEEFGERMNKWGEDFALRFGDDFERDMDKMHEDLEHLPRFEDFDFKEMDENLKHMHNQLRDHETELKRVEENMHQFEIELSEQLVKDGYLKKGEKIDSFNWDHSGDLIVNGKKINEKDIKKYEAINEKFFSGKGGLHFEN